MSKRWGSLQGSPETIKPLLESAVINILPFLTALYIFSFWILPKDWNVGSEIEGSWVYALGKFRSMHMSLGKDSWFTYGPISHWFGPPLGAEKYQPVPYYVLGLFTAGLFFVSLKKVFKNANIGISIKTTLIFLFLYSLTLIDNWVLWCQPCIDDNRLEVYLVVVTLLTFTTGYFFEKTKLWWVYCLMILSIIGLFYKFSFGILSTLCFLSAFLYAAISRHFTLRRLLSLGGIYLLLTIIVFFLTSGSLNLFHYLDLELELSSKYSEVMAFHDQMLPFQYGLAILFAAMGTVIGVVSASKLPKHSALLFIISLLAFISLIFKIGHVRADMHVLFFYTKLAPFFVVLTALAFSNHHAIPQKKKLGILFFSVSVYVLFISIQVFLFSNSVPTIEKKRAWYFLSPLQNWKMLGERYKAGIRGKDTERISEKINILKSRHGTLFSFLTSECRSLAGSVGASTITFYPGELMFAEAVGGCKLKPSPNLQIYSSGPHTKIRHLEADFLASEDRPNIIVIGSGSIDGRNSVSEYTDILPVLFRNYEVVSSIEDYVVLESTKMPVRRSDVIICSDNSQGVEGEFFQLKLKSLAKHYDVLWYIATFLFKSPELTVQVSAKNEKSEDIAFSFRGYLSQLKQGVYVSQDTINTLILENFRRSQSVVNPTQNQVSISRSVSTDLYIDASAIAIRNDGTWNLPVIPHSLPLQVQYCSFRKDNS